MNREEFGRASPSYVTYLFNSIQSQNALTSDFVKGLCYFDLETILVGPIELAVYCFSQLFTSFRLRSFFTSEQEGARGEEYRSFLDDIRKTYPDLVQPTLFVTDTISFLLEQSSLRSRPLLYKLFRLACLCLDEVFQVLTAVKFGYVDTDDPICSHVDVVLPVQSFSVMFLLGLKQLDPINQWLHFFN